MPEPAAEGDRAGGLTAAPGRASEPTLPELLGSAWRRSGALGRGALALLALAVLAFAAWLLFGRGGGSFDYDGPEAPPFSVSWGSEMERVEPEPGELLRLESGEGTLTPGSQGLAISPLAPEAIPATREEEPIAALALAADREGREIESGGDARVVVEGRTTLAVDRGPEAYALSAVARLEDGSIVIGKRFLVPDPDRPGEGVQIEISETTDDPRVIEKVAEAPAGFFLNWPIQLLLEDAASVRTAESLEEPLRSFSFE